MYITGREKVSAMTYYWQTVLVTNSHTQYVHFARQILVARAGDHWRVNKCASVSGRHPLQLLLRGEHRWDAVHDIYVEVRTSSLSLWRLYRSRLRSTDGKIVRRRRRCHRHLWRLCRPQLHVPSAVRGATGRWETFSWLWAHRLAAHKRQGRQNRGGGQQRSQRQLHCVEVGEWIHVKLGLPSAVAWSLSVVKPLQDPGQVLQRAVKRYSPQRTKRGDPRSCGSAFACLPATARQEPEDHLELCTADRGSAKEVSLMSAVPSCVSLIRWRRKKLSSRCKEKQQ